MPIQLLMPALSPTMKAGTIAKWNKKEGDKVKIGEVVAEIETDKAIMELESIEEGVIGKLLIEAGTENVPVNTLIAILLEEGEELTNIALSSLGSSTHYVPVLSDIKPKEETKLNIKNLSSSNKLFISPLAKRIASQNNINLSTIIGSGPKGRIIKSDILDLISNNSSHFTPNKLNNSECFKENSNSNVSIPNSSMRKIIAYRLSESKREIPHFYLEVSCNMDKLIALRSEINLSSSIKLSVNDFIIKATALSLRNVPEANVSWSEEATIQYQNIDIAVAVAIEGGLITPIIANADRKSIIHISNEMKDLASRARNFSLKPEEFQGGSFTISNLGMYGIDSFKAIINPPQSGIFAIGATSEQPIVRDGVIVVASIMKVTLSCDHRVIDGAIAAKFLNQFKDYIEHPVRILAY